MKFISTRGNKKELAFSEAIMKGLADDGGLYVPVSLPKIDISRLDYDPDRDPYSKLACQLIAPFAEGDILEKDLKGICERAFDFPIRLAYDEKNDRHAILELFWGPTFAFKDFGARFLAESMESILQNRGERKLILVATSGDTGSAVGSAFLGKKSIDVKILFPKGMVSQRQKAQLCAFSGNVNTYQVEGTFDDCQRMVKEAFMDAELNGRYDFSSANSINIARLIPQMTYYFYASLKFHKDRKRKPVIIVPTGNAGNVTAAYYAMLMGAPIEKLFLACNSNHSIVDYLNTGEYKGHKTIKTLANAMDVGNPSNMERLMFMFPSIEEFRRNVDAMCVSDDEIRSAIKSYYDAHSAFICPHTACSVYAMEKRFSDDDDVIAVSTASPVKFSDVIQDILGMAPPEDERFVRIISGKQQFTEIKADYHQLFS